MDLYSAESKKIQTLVQDWLSHPEQELEATFGVGGVVDSTTFLNIAQRLRTKGYEPLPQDDRLSILTQNHIRLSLHGLGVLQGYCRDNVLAGKPYTAMIKDRTSSESNLDLEEYTCRIKSRREISLKTDDHRVRELIDNWNVTKKAFRLIRRWTFKGNGMRIDMSIVRSTPKKSNGDYDWSRSFQDHNLFKQAPIYEVEVELLRSEDTSTLDTAVKCFIRGIGEILRAIQKNTLLIRKSIRDRVLAGYAALNGAPSFRGPAPRALHRKNMISTITEGEPNIRTGYNVTDKADGLRCLGYCNDKGELFLIDMGMTVFRTGLRNTGCANSLVDGEWVTADKEGKAINHYLLFDIFKSPGGVEVSTLPFAVLGKEEEDSRYKELSSWIQIWTEGKTEVITKHVTEETKLQVSMKLFRFAMADEPTAIFEAASIVLNTTQIYYTDGLIFTPNTLPLPPKDEDAFKEQFKWKPSHDNTIDFLINFEKDPVTPSVDKVTIGIHPDTGETVRFKTMRLYVGSRKDIVFDDPRATILDMLPLPDKYKKKGKQNVYKPILFNPEDHPDTLANTCYRLAVVDEESREDMTTTEITNEPIQDRSVVEMRYDLTQPPGWRWIPIRVRHDKTERLQRAVSQGGPIYRTLNSENTANDTWDCIHDPITESMIRKGTDQPTPVEIAKMRGDKESLISKVYYDRTASEQDLLLVKGMRNFHNWYIKGDILYESVLRDGGKGPGGKTLIDFACGKGADINNWRFGRAAFVLGVDMAGDNIIDPGNGVYKRYLNTLIKYGRSTTPLMVFAIGDSSKPIITGEAGATPEERDILRSVFGQPPEGPVPKLISTEASSMLKGGANVGVCMFAIHYFFKDKDTLDGFIKNVSDCIAPGGYFIGCCFDGDRVFNLLRSVEAGQSRLGMNGETKLWSIRKEYERDELTDSDESVGLAIDVEFITIGTEHREYLVPFRLLKRKMAEIGFELLTTDETKAIKLRNSTATFEESFAMAEKAGKKFEMASVVREFSFLNRWFIFKRRAMSQVEAEEELQEAADEVNRVEREAQEVEEEEGRAASIAPREGAEAEAMEAVAKGIEEKPEPTVEAPFRLPGPEDKLDPAQVYRFGMSAALQDTLRLGDKEKGAARWISPSALFPIRDPGEAGVEYPSIAHFMAGMQLKFGGRAPDLAKELFSTTGKIHQAAEGARRLKSGRGGKLSEKDYYESIKDEAIAIKNALSPSALRPYKIKMDESEWNKHKDELLRNALKQRWDRDKRFHTIVEKARTLKKYLLYYTSNTGGGEMSGVLRENGTIDGENKMGRYIMEIAGFRL
jgi:hypothetical protein